VGGLINPSPLPPSFTKGRGRKFERGLRPLSLAHSPMADCGSLRGAKPIKIHGASKRGHDPSFFYFPFPWQEKGIKGMG